MATEHQNRVYGAELARENDALDDGLPGRPNGGDACDVLAKWDGRSDIDSVGTHLFQEFWKRAQDAQALWLTPFDPNDPVGHAARAEPGEPAGRPGDAGRAGLPRASKHVPVDAPWGSLQVAGDDGAPAIPIGGGEGFAGNANAVSTRTPAANTDHLYPVSYGSSHIQAVAFSDHGRLNAQTILTYGESMNRRSPYSSDQTRMFSRQKWVHFAWTPAQIRRDAGADLHGHRTVTGGRLPGAGPGSVPRRRRLAGPDLWRSHDSWPRSWARTRARMRETCIWVTPISSAIWAWDCCLKKRR